MVISSSDLFLIKVDRALIYIFVALISGHLLFNNRGKLLDYFSALFVAVGLSSIIKYIVHKPRPVPHFPGLSFDGSSFPSTHATIAFVTATFFCHVLTSGGSSKRKNLNVIACIVVFVIATFIAYLRVFVGAHYLIDVVGGAVVGSLISLPFRYYDVFARRIR